MYGFCYEKNPAPPELLIGLNWRNFSLPYVAGGQVDQPQRLFRRMSKALRVFDAVMAWKEKYTLSPKQEELWYHLHAADMKILHWIWNKQNG